MESAEGRDPSPEMLESMTMLKGVRMAFGSGQKFWPLALWSFIMYGTVMMYQCLQIGPYYDSVYGWRTAA